MVARHFVYLLHVYLPYLCHMKFTHYLLAIYTLLLACIPCQDETITALQKTDNQVSVSAQANSNHPEKPDLCSPFCVCACCSGITIQQAFAALPQILAASFPQEKIFNYAHHPSSGDLTSIWQPPRV